MAKKKVTPKPMPRTGNGQTGGKKPKPSELAMLNSWGQVRSSQPKGWSGFGKLYHLFKDKK